MEADSAGEERGSDARDGGDLDLGDAGGDEGTEAFVAGLTPEPAGFEEVIGKPEVGVGGGVWIEDLPSPVGVLAPAPRG